MADPAPALCNPSDQTSARDAPTRPFWIMAGAALLIRLVLSPWWGHGADMGTFIGWGRQLAQTGLADFYSPDRWCDYLPGYLYVLWMLGHIPVPSPIEITQPFTAWISFDYALFKLPAMFADVAAAWIVWRVVRGEIDKPRYWVAALYLFNPAILINSTIWGQVDGFHALFILLGLYLLSRHRVVLAAVALGYAVSIKPHAAVVLPVAAAYAWRQNIDTRRVIATVIIVPLVFVATFLPFAGWSPIRAVELVRERFTATAEQYQYATINAMNLWYLCGLNWRPDGDPVWLNLTPRVWAMVLVGMSCAFTMAWVIQRQRRTALWTASGLLFLALFLFVTRAHERHLFPALAILTAVAGMRRVIVYPLVVLSVTYVANAGLSWLYMLPEYRSAELCNPILGNIICIAALAMVVLIPVLMWRTDRTVKGVDET